MGKLKIFAATMLICGVSYPALSQTTGSSAASAASAQLSAASVVKANATIAQVQGSAPAAYDNTNGVNASANVYALATGLTNVYDLVNIGAATTEAKSSTGALTSTTGTVNLTGLNTTLQSGLLVVPLVGLGISADAVASATTAGIDANGNFYSTGSASITNLGVTGSLLGLLNINRGAAANAGANTVLADIAGLKLTLNEQLVSQTSNSIFAQTNALHLSLNDYVFGGAVLSGDVIIGHSEAQISAVPEPAAWASMLVGFGFIGALLRKRSSRAMLAIN